MWSNRELRRLGPLFEGKVINVSAGDNVDKEGATYDAYFPRATEFWTSNYMPGAFRGFVGRERELLLDLEQPLAPELTGGFDVVFNHTTLEHVFEVFTATANLCALSRDIVVVVVPFAQTQHESPGYQDFWRFTPTCMRRLMARSGFEVIYEAANDDFNAATYLLVVASRHPERWRGKLPAYQPVQKAARWIGRPTTVDRVVRRAQKAWRTLGAARRP